MASLVMEEKPPDPSSSSGCPKLDASATSQPTVDFEVVKLGLSLIQTGSIDDLWKLILEKTNEEQRSATLREIKLGSSNLFQVTPNFGSPIANVVCGEVASAVSTGDITGVTTIKGDSFETAHQVFDIIPERNKKFVKDSEMIPSLEVTMDRPSPNYSKQTCCSDANTNNWKALFQEPTTITEFVLEFTQPTYAGSSVKLPLGTSSQGLEKWRNLLVGYSLGRKLPYSLVRERAFLAWTKFGLSDVSSSKEGFFYFKFKSEEGCNNVLANGPWTFAKQAFVFKKWVRDMDFKKEKFTSFPIWCKLYNIPRVYWTKDGLGKIASALGTPLKADEVTAKSLYIDYARVCIDMQLHHKFPSAFNVETEFGEVFEMRVEYAWTPTKLSTNPKSITKEWVKKVEVVASIPKQSSSDLSGMELGTKNAVETPSDSNNDNSPGLDPTTVKIAGKTSNENHKKPLIGSSSTPQATNKVKPNKEENVTNSEEGFENDNDDDDFEFDKWTREKLKRKARRANKLGNDNNTKNSIDVH